MEQLQELMNMLGDGFLPAQPNKMGSKVLTFFNYLRGTDFPDEEVAAKKIGVVPGSSDFRKVKHYLKLALINGVTAVQPGCKPEEVKGTVDTSALTWNYVAALGASEGAVRDFLAVEQSKGIIALAKEFDTEESYPTILAQTLAHEARKSSKRKVTQELIADALEELAYAHKVQHFRQFSTHSTFLNLTRAKEDEKTTFFVEAIDRLESIDSVDRDLTRFGLFYLKLKLRLVKRQYDQVILLAKSELKGWTDDDGDPLRTKVILNIKLNMLRAYQYTSENEEGLQLSLQTIDNPPSNGIDVYGFYEFGMIFALRSKKFKILGHLYDRAQDYEETNRLKQHFRETFLIIEAYIQILAKLGYIEADDNIKNKSKLRIGRFINEMDFSYKEKERRNIHVIIIKILYHSLYEQGQYFDQADSIRKYIQRHLSDKRHVRAKNILLAMIVYLENGCSNKITNHKTRVYLQKLENNQYGSCQQDPYTEFLHYEFIWYLLTKTSGV